MPTYEYKCPNGHVFEKFQKISDKPRGKCPTCGKSAERMISGGAGLVFKGSGFYITDYGKDGKGARKPPSESSSGESKPDAKPESKPEKKTDAPASKPGSSSAKPTKSGE